MSSMDHMEGYADGLAGAGAQLRPVTESALAWRRIPVADVYGDSLSYRLREAGYRTLGDVLAATEDDIAVRVRWAGPKRAKMIRQQALDAAKVMAASAPEIGEAPPETTLSWSQLLMLLAAFSAGVVAGAALTFM